MTAVVKNFSQLSVIGFALPSNDDLAEGKTLVIIPTYNESENIRIVLELIFGLDLPDLDVLVIDDNSPDGTANVVRELAAQ
ncbi:MAG: glycosyltransferase, partial [Gloeomargarita sp. SKYG116]|nr:glycosyltransferase [Gloeomargarita sp. SKYG116]MDW8402472.1 glycosyltransferase [Gloeomargarita sp. SKYGB_i_bin116]